MITKEYLAGFIDGEGYISLLKHKDIRVKKGYTLFPVLKVSNTNKDVMLQISKFIKGNVLINSPITERNKEVYSIRIHSFDKIKDILVNVRPHLIVKDKQADLMIEYCNNRLKRKVRGYTERDYEIVKLLSQLNKRG